MTNNFRWIFFLVYNIHYDVVQVRLGGPKYMGMSTMCVYIYTCASQPHRAAVNCTLIKFTLLAAVEKCSQASVEFKEVGLAEITAFCYKK